MQLSEAQPAVEAALQRLIDKPITKRPFVIVEATVGWFFVQFAGSKGEPLIFDVPRLHVSEPIDGPGRGAELAVETLSKLGLPDHADVTITESDTFESTAS